MITHGTLIFLTVFLEGTFLNAFDINGILPCLSLIYLLYVGFYVELYPALIISAVLGLLVDMSGTFPIGSTVIIYALLVFLINYLSTFLDFRNLGSWIIGIVIGTTLTYFSYFLIVQMVFENTLCPQTLVSNYLVQLLYNVLATALFYPFFKAYENRSQHRKTSQSLMDI